MGELCIRRRGGSRVMHIWVLTPCWVTDWTLNSLPPTYSWTGTRSSRGSPYITLAARAACQACSRPSGPVTTVTPTDPAPSAGLTTHGKPTAPAGYRMLVRAMQMVYHQQTKNLLVSYSPKKLGFFYVEKEGA